MMWKLILSTLALCSMVVAAEMSDTSSATSITGAEIATTDSTTAVSTTDTLVSPSVESTPRCTLEITTKPEGASISLDGTSKGFSPVMIPDVDTGKHTLIIQKKGFYQKKAVITLMQQQKTPLVFELAAPGRLEVMSVPDTAQVTIDGVLKGTTPYIDSVVKPGTYYIGIVKKSFLPVEDSVIIAGGDTITLIDTLKISEAYQDSVATYERIAAKKVRRFNIGLIGSAFGLFLLIITIIEARER